MQDSLILHYVNEYLNDWLKNLVKSYPVMPLNAILTNYLYMPDTNIPEVSRLTAISANLVQFIKILQTLPDTAAYEGAQEAHDQHQQTSLDRLITGPTPAINFINSGFGGLDTGLTGPNPQTA